MTLTDELLAEGMSEAAVARADVLTVNGHEYPIPEGLCGVVEFVNEHGIVGEGGCARTPHASGPHSWEFE